MCLFLLPRISSTLLPGSGPNYFTRFRVYGTFSWTTRRCMKSVPSGGSPMRRPRDYLKSELFTWIGRKNATLKTMKSTTGRINWPWWITVSCFTGIAVSTRSSSFQLEKNAVAIKVTTKKAQPCLDPPKSNRYDGQRRISVVLKCNRNNTAFRTMLRDDVHV